MRKSHILFCAASAALLLSLTACGVTITAVHLPDEVQVNVGATAETAATYESKQEADAAAQQAAADRIDWTWAIADDTIATVDGSGVVRALRAAARLSLSLPQMASLLQTAPSRSASRCKGLRSAI